MPVAGRSTRPVFTVLDTISSAAVQVAAVIAPAGSGKTTALEQWLRERRPQHHWITASGPESAEQLATQLAEHEPSLMVIDDTHRLGGTRPIERLIEQGVAAGWTFVVVGRSEPPTDFWRLVGRGKAALAGFEDLLLDRDAVAQMAADCGVRITDAQLDALHESTLGWPALVKIALNESARSTTDGTVGELSYTEATQYVQSEVIESLHPDLRSFCARVAELGTFSAALAQAALRTSGDDELDQVWRSQTMLVRAKPARPALQSEAEPEFTFPPIAAQALRRDVAGAGPEEIADLHRRAALWHESRGSWDRALPHMLRARPEDAVRQLLRMLTAMEPQGRSEETLQWFRHLPQKLRMQPAPTIGLVLALVQAGLADEARQLIDQIDTKSWTRVDQLAELAMAESMVERMRFHHPQATAAAERSWSLLTRVDPSAVSATRLSYLRVMAVEQLREIRLWEGDLAAVRDLMSTIQHDVIRSELQLSLVHSTAVTALAALDSGDLRAAASKAQSALRLAERRQYDDTHIVAEASTVLAAIAWEHDRTTTAIEQLEQAWALARRGIFPTTCHRIALLLAPMLAEVGRTAEAWSILEELGGVARRTTDDCLRSRLLAATALVHLHTNDLKAARSAQASLKDVSTPRDVLRHRTLLATRLADTGDLRTLARTPADQPEPIEQVVTLFARAHADLATDPEQAVRHLAEALRRAEDLDLWRTVVDLSSGLSTILPLLKDHADLVHGPGPAYVRRIATAVAASSQRESVLSEREAEIAQFLPTRKSNAHIAAELYISKNTVKTHLRHIYQKLGVEQRDDAVERLKEIGLLQPED